MINGLNQANAMQYIFRDGIIFLYSTSGISYIKILTFVSKFKLAFSVKVVFSMHCKKEKKL